MYLDLNGCTELELISYKIILLTQINSNQDVIKKIDKELTRLHKIKEKEENPIQLNKKINPTRDQPIVYRVNGRMENK